MTNAETHMGAMSAALRMLLANDELTKPDDLLIAACSGVTATILDVMMSHAFAGSSTFLAVFEIEGEDALLEKIMIFDCTTTKRGEIDVCVAKFVRLADGTFSVRSANRDNPYEYIFDRNGHRLQRRAVKNDRNRAMLETRGLQALIEKAATPACQEEGRTASMTRS